MNGIDRLSVPSSSSIPPTYARLAEDLRSGAGRALEDEDLLALALSRQSGHLARTAARRILGAGGREGLRRRGPRARWWSLLGIHQAIRLEAFLELADRLADGAVAQQAEVRTPGDVYAVTADIRSARREHFLGLYLNTRNRLLARETISVGSLNASIVHPREVFEPALRHGAASLVVVHNHPSGVTDPSPDDLAITRRLREAGELLGVALLDHVIVGCDSFTSLKESRSL